jgi:hypothetical protein
MNCKVFQNEIEEAPDPRVLDNNVLAHVVSCTSCQSVLKDRIGLDLLLKDLPAVEASSDFDWRLRGRLDGNRATRSGFHANLLRGWGTVRLAGVAAVLFLALAGLIGYSIRLRPTQPAGVVAKAETMPIGKATSYANLLRDIVVQADASSGVVETGSTAVQEVIRQHGPWANESNTRFPKHQRRAVARPDGLRIVDFAVRPAAVLFGDKGNQSNVIAVADASGRFSVPERDLRVKLPEARGQMRTVSLRSVTFGSQQILESPGKVLASSSTQGIW